MLAVVCTALAFLLFFALIAEIGPVRATVITYVNPAVAVALGVGLLGERFTAGMAVGFVLILAGSLLATRARPLERAPPGSRPRAPALPRPPRASRQPGAQPGADLVAVLAEVGGPRRVRAGVRESLTGKRTVRTPSAPRSGRARARRRARRPRRASAPGRPGRRQPDASLHCARVRSASVLQQLAQRLAVGNAGLVAREARVGASSGGRARRRAPRTAVVAGAEHEAAVGGRVGREGRDARVGVAERPRRLAAPEPARGLVRERGELDLQEVEVGRARTAPSGGRSAASTLVA